VVHAPQDAPAARKRGTRSQLRAELLENRLAPALNFAPALTFSAGQFPYAVISADFNGDGKLDLATANSNSNDVSFFILPG
jgi:hypothetical protein